MAATVNARDVLLAAAPVRLENVLLPPNILVPGIASIELDGPSNIFRVSAAGTGTPSSITLTATLRQITGVVNWSVIAGTATLTVVSDLVRVLDFANMTANFITVRVEVIFQGLTYQSFFSISKITDGVPGQAGARGPVDTFGFDNAWTDAVANAEVALIVGNNTRILGDKVTIRNNVGFAEQRFWSGTSWLVVGKIVSGNMLVDGAIAAGSAIIGDAAIDSAKIAGEITSTNWNPISGTTGWAINRSGNASFNNVRVRGDVEADKIVANTIVTNHVQANTATLAVSVFTQASIAIADDAIIQQLPTFTSKGGSVAISFGMVMLSNTSAVFDLEVIINGNIIYTFHIQNQQQGDVITLPWVVHVPGNAASCSYALRSQLISGSGSIEARGGYAIETIR